MNKPQVKMVTMQSGVFGAVSTSDDLSACLRHRAAVEISIG
jgi:hypothetical protein